VRADCRFPTITRGWVISLIASGTVAQYDNGMFRVKICGVSTVADALAASAAGADAIGLNFYRGSKRCTDVATARAISDVLPEVTKRVGVFVNANVAEIDLIAEQVGLDAVQLHGDEPPGFVTQLPRGVGVVRAFRCGEQGLAPLRSYLTDCRSLGRLPDAVLIDSAASTDFGGTGYLADWALLAQEREMLDDVPFILAGGLTPDNVAEAIAVVRPDGVDVASGVEREPASKDAALVRRFVEAAREAFAGL
jgi:phosphoribosylanthranilate isomerase